MSPSLCRNHCHQGLQRLSHLNFQMFGLPATFVWMISNIIMNVCTPSPTKVCSLRFMCCLPIKLFKSLHELATILQLTVPNGQCTANAHDREPHWNIYVRIRADIVREKKLYIICMSSTTNCSSMVEQVLDKFFHCRQAVSGRGIVERKLKRR